MCFAHAAHCREAMCTAAALDAAVVPALQPSPSRIRRRICPSTIAKTTGHGGLNFMPIRLALFLSVEAMRLGRLGRVRTGTLALTSLGEDLRSVGRCSGCHCAQRPVVCTSAVRLASH